MQGEFQSPADGGGDTQSNTLAHLWAYVHEKGVLKNEINYTQIIFNHSQLNTIPIALLYLSLSTPVSCEGHNELITA